MNKKIGVIMNKKTCLLVSLIILLTLPLLANHISIDGNVTLTDQNTTLDYTHIQFNISWENSWRVSTGPSNWDAAWVFAKWKLASGTEWKHCTLNTSGHTAPTGSTIDAASDGTGIFIYRDAVGSGPNNWDGAKLRWNYGTDLVADDATVDVKVFAIEMVYVPAGAFTVGSGGTESGSFTNGSWTSGATIPLQISSENALNIAQSDGNLWGTSSSGNNTIGDAGTLPAAFPKGYAAFYCMKYEISQGQYADFLNTLTGTQDGNRYYSGTSNRYTIGGSAGSRSATVPNRACNYLSWMDGAAYSDWAGLRPMTELEYEKACRGTGTAVANEYAWGNTNIASSAYTLSNDGAYNATVSNPASDPIGNASYFTTDGSIDGPLRCGIFATGTSTRVAAGASYYGVMEMSGNLWERPVTLGNSTGRAFTGTNGNGVLDGDGNADVTDWPGTTASGSGFRGGTWGYLAASLRVSDRTYAAYPSAGRYFICGFRLSRTITP